MDFLIGGKTLDEIYGSTNVDMKEELKPLDEKRGSETVDMSEFKTLDEIYGAYNVDMTELEKLDSVNEFDMSNRKLKTFDDLKELKMDDVEDNVSAFDCSTMLSPGTEVGKCVKNDGSSIPCRKLGSLDIPAIITDLALWMCDAEILHLISSTNVWKFGLIAGKCFAEGIWVD